MTGETNSIYEGAVVVTGAAQGIGAAVAEHLVPEGVHVLLADLHGDKVKSVSDSLRMPSVQVDICDPDATDPMVVRGVSEFGKIHGVGCLLGPGGDFVSGTVLNVSGGYWHGR